MLQEKLDLPIFAHPLTLKVMSDPPALQCYRRFMWGHAPSAAGKPLPGLIRTPRFRFQVIHTPGHSPDHVSLFEPEQKWLFCGDLYLGEKLNGFMQGEDIAAHLDSLKKVIRLGPQTLFCSLKGKVENAAARLADKYSYWWDLGCTVRDLHGRGASPRQILRKLFHDEILFYYLSARNWGRRYLVESLINNREIFQNNKH
jgi:glyoxylase-like metal-dependent hydrolase (beta-lactamase superfamily II)